ncbi:MAG: DUF1553 domain-containing protein [Planctomycetia bacterium]|nr:DUF1553 domain-containing protein [Planctomycetia bacterium]
MLAILASGGILDAGQPTSQSSVGEERTHDKSLLFSRDIVPVLTKAGCNMGACHGSFQGRGGMTLSLLGFNPTADYDVLFKQSRGRRVSPSAPDQSLLLRKATAAVPHGGGRRFEEDSVAYRAIRDYIAQGANPPGIREPEIVRLETSPRELTLRVGSEAQLVVTAHWSDKTTQDVTKLAQYDSRIKARVDVDDAGRITALEAGKTPVNVRFLGQVASVSVSVPFAAPTEFSFPSRHFLDVIAADEWKRLGIQPAALADDSTFLRRVHLDLIGTLPTADETRRFLADAAFDKRSRVVDALLERAEYVDYWSLRWGDLLRAHRRYLGDKGLASFNGWIRQSVRDNKPLDVMTRELLTAQGNLFTNGPVAYYFIDAKVEDLAETTSQVFLGVRLQCTKCHHHPNEVWSQQDYYGLAAFFSKLETKDSGQAGARFGGPKSVRPSAAVNPNRMPEMAAAPRAFGVADLVPAEPGAAGSIVDPRAELATWITRRDNPYFSRNFANRYWAALMGVGLVEPVDDMRATNPASMPRLLDALAEDFAHHGFDTKHLLRTICNSRIYQLAPELSPQRDADGSLFTHRVPRRLSAEVLLDAVNQVTGNVETFVGQPLGTRAIALPDPSIASHFLNTFGRPPRSSPCDCARGIAPDLSQVLHFANGTALHEKIIATKGRLSERLRTKRSDQELTEELYLTAFARRPTASETQIVTEVLAAGPSRDEAWQDILWALINCSEFMFGH